MLNWKRGLKECEDYAFYEDEQMHKHLIPMKEYQAKFCQHVMVKRADINKALEVSDE